MTEAHHQGAALIHIDVHTEYMPQTNLTRKYIIIMPNQIAAESIREGQTITLKGKVGFSNIAKPLYEGSPELAKKVQREINLGRNYQTNYTHTSLTVTNVELQPVDPNNLTLEEQFVNERLFEHKKNPEKGLGYEAVSRGDILPTVLRVGSDNNAVQVKELQGELAQGQDIILVLNTYKPKNHPKRGIGIQTVIVFGDEVKYANFTNNRVDQDVLGRLGVTFNGNITPTTSTLTGNGQPQGSAPQNTDNDGLPMPGMGNHAQVPQSQQGYQAPQAQPQQGNQYPQQAPQQAPQQSYQAPQNQPQGQPQAQPQYNQAPQGYQNQQAPQGYQNQQPQAQPQQPQQPPAPNAASAFGGYTGQSPQGQSGYEAPNPGNLNTDPWSGEPSQGPGITY